METYISILRGINVSGHKLIKMEALRQLFDELGFRNTQTYIQSGNIIFQAKKQKTLSLEKNIAGAISKKFGFDVPVLVKDIKAFEKIIDKNPFVQDATKDSAFMHVTFLSGEPAKADFVKIDREQFLPDELEWWGEALYLYCPNKYSNSKLTNNFLESKFRITATTRNWRTTNELLNIAKKM